MIGRCEPCDKTLDGTIDEHLRLAHADELFHCWVDPESDTWTILERCPELKAQPPF